MRCVPCPGARLRAASRFSGGNDGSGRVSRKLKPTKKAQVGLRWGYFGGACVFLCGLDGEERELALQALASSVEVTAAKSCQAIGKIHFHPNTVSSTDTFIQFHQNETVLG